MEARRDGALMSVEEPFSVLQCKICADLRQSPGPDWRLVERRMRFHNGVSTVLVSKRAIVKPRGMVE